MVIAFVGTFVSVGLLVTFGIWELANPKTPKTKWYGNGCLEVSTVSVPLLMNDTSVIDATILDTVGLNDITLETVTYSNSTGSQHLSIAGFLSSETVTGARQLYSDAMKDVEKALETQFGENGIYDITDCGLVIELPTNVNITTHLP